MKSFFKRIFLIALGLVLIQSNADAQKSTLAEADSLFKTQKYTEAFELYEGIFDSGQASPAMLTRMAFIKEGLGNETEALYFLNLYYLKTSDKSALQKMREIADEHNLTGYEYSDLKFFTGFLRKYLNQILLSLMVFSVVLIAYGYRKVKKGEKLMVSALLQLITLTGIMILSNQWFIPQTAMVQQAEALLMSGPSGGSEPIDFIRKGNKVVVLDSDVLWSKIQWGTAEGYIRSKNLKRL